MPYPNRNRPRGEAADSRGCPLESSRLPMRPQSAQVARRRVRETLELFGADPAVIDDAELLTSEVVTNGLVHAARPGGEMRLLIFRDGDRVTVEVHDPSRALPHPDGAPDMLSESGRGLFLVKSLAADHGAHRTEGGGKAVWFQVLAWRSRSEADLPAVRS
ncbi:MAG: hypothetical protein JWO67_3565 [Streptosporangiaceae bacterium]|nr:hypothetical protein [Streptosporangiaceae bacterium]